MANPMGPAYLRMKTRLAAPKETVIGRTAMINLRERRRIQSYLHLGGSEVSLPVMTM